MPEVCSWVNQGWPSFTQKRSSYPFQSQALCPNPQGTLKPLAQVFMSTLACPFSKSHTPSTAPKALLPPCSSVLSLQAW